MRQRGQLHKNNEKGGTPLVEGGPGLVYRSVVIAVRYITVKQSQKSVLCRMSHNLKHTSSWQYHLRAHHQCNRMQ
jgi:hypothetical protein